MSNGPLNSEGHANSPGRRVLYAGPRVVVTSFWVDDTNDLLRRRRLTVALQLLAGAVLSGLLAVWNVRRVVTDGSAVAVLLPYKAARAVAIAGPGNWPPPNKGANLARQTQLVRYLP
jgi:hypothetical protein